MHLVLGTLYLFANMTTAVTSHLRRFDPSITYQKTLLCFATALGAQGCTMLVGGLLEKRYGARKTVLFGGYILVLGTLLASTATSLAELIVYNGIMFGIGLGICYSAPITCACKFLPNRKGTVTGSIVAGFGLGAFIFGLVSTSLLNPHHLNVSDYPDERDAAYFASDSEVAENVPKTFLTLGVCYFFLVSFAGYCLREPTEAEEAEILSAATSLHDRVSLNENSTSGSPRTNSRFFHHVDDGAAINPLAAQTYQKTSLADTSTHSDTDAKKEEESLQALAFDVGPWELLRNPLAWHLSSCLILTTVGGMYLAGTQKVYGQQIFRSDAFLSTVSSISSIFNAVGRLFWGSMADRFGPIKTITGLSLIFSIVILSYASSPLLGGEVGFAIWTFMIFFFEGEQRDVYPKATQSRGTDDIPSTHAQSHSHISHTYTHIHHHTRTTGGNFALYPHVVIQLFGTKNSGSNYGLIFSAYSACVVVNITVLARFSVSFEAACESMSLLTFLGFLNLLAFDGHLRAMCKKSDR